jgi:hypothetical protein
MLDALVQRVGDAGRHAKIHIRDPHANLDILSAVDADLPVPFDAVGPDARRVEVVLGRFCFI